jgi:hypothetical protein
MIKAKNDIHAPTIAGRIRTVERGMMPQPRDAWDIPQGSD